MTVNQRLRPPSRPSAPLTCPLLINIPCSSLFCCASFSSSFAFSSSTTACIVYTRTKPWKLTTKMYPLRQPISVIPVQEKCLLTNQNTQNGPAVRTISTFTKSNIISRERLKRRLDAASTDLRLIPNFIRSPLLPSGVINFCSQFPLQTTHLGLSMTKRETWKEVNKEMYLIRVGSKRGGL